MDTTNKNKTEKKSPEVIITKGKIQFAIEDTLFPKKIARINDILSRTEFIKDSNTPGLINIFE